MVYTRTPGPCGYTHFITTSMFGRLPGEGQPSDCDVHVALQSTRDVIQEIKIQCLSRTVNLDVYLIHSLVQQPQKAVLYPTLYFSTIGSNGEGDKSVIHSCIILSKFYFTKVYNTWTFNTMTHCSLMGKPKNTLYSKLYTSYQSSSSFLCTSNFSL